MVNKLTDDESDSSKRFKVTRMSRAEWKTSQRGHGCQGGRPDNWQLLSIAVNWLVVPKGVVVTGLATHWCPRLLSDGFGNQLCPGGVLPLYNVQNRGGTLHQKSDKVSMLQKIEDGDKGMDSGQVSTQLRITHWSKWVSICDGSCERWLMTQIIVKNYQPENKGSSIFTLMPKGTMVLNLWIHWNSKCCL